MGLLTAIFGNYSEKQIKKIIPIVDKIEAIYVFRWNRDYLSDFKLDVDLAQWDRSVVCEFAGSSHDCITVEKYIKI